METINIDEAVEAVKGELYGAADNQQIKGVSIDSRTLKKGDLFVAIKGEKVDGHSFIEDAIKKDASAVMIQKSKIKLVSASKKVCIIGVEDTIRAIGDLAAYYRSQFKIPVVGITGSVGKTTSKEFTAACLSVKYNVLKNKSSYNSLTGVPLTIFNLSRVNEVCVLEIGANHLGEIRRLSDIAMPQIGVITNIAPSHLEAFKTLEGVLEEKSAILYKADTAIINGDDPMLSRLETRNLLPKNVFKFGIHSSSFDLVAENIELGNGIKFRVKDVEFNLPLLGNHNVYNALAAISVGLHFELSLQQMAFALKEVHAMIHRDELINMRGIYVIDSTYNANPFSMRAAIRELCDMKGEGKKIAVLGDMLELGENGEQFHEDIGQFLKEQGVDFVVAVGNMAKLYTRKWPKENAKYFKSVEEAIKFLNELIKSEFIKKEDKVLVKASNAMKLDKIVEEFKKQERII